MPHNNKRHEKIHYCVPVPVGHGHRRGVRSRGSHDIYIYLCTKTEAHRSVRLEGARAVWPLRADGARVVRLNLSNLCMNTEFMLYPYCATNMSCHEPVTRTGRKGRGGEQIRLHTAHMVSTSMLWTRQGMKCLVDSIPLRMRVGSTNTRPHLEGERKAWTFDTAGDLYHKRG